jgi:hypothetical protein
LSAEALFSAAVGFADCWDYPAIEAVIVVAIAHAINLAEII